MEMIKNKKEIFSELRDCLYLKDTFDHINEVRISFLKNPQLIGEIKELQVIELKKIEDFSSYVNYDHFLVFKVNDSYYFCDTALSPSLGIYSMIKILDFNLYLRKDKMEKINENSLN